MAEKIKAKSGTSQGFEIVANREGLMGLALACLKLAIQSENNEQVCWFSVKWRTGVPR